MRCTRRSLGVATVVLAGALAGVTAITTAANAQQLAAPRLARTASAPTPTTPTTVIDSRVNAAAAAALARDSVAYYRHEGRVQRWDGGSFLVAGLAAITVAWVQYARSPDSMGMTGGQGAAFATGAALGIFGGTRLVLSRESFASAARWREVQVAGMQR